MASGSLANIAVRGVGGSLLSRGLVFLVPGALAQGDVCGLASGNAGAVPDTAEVLEDATAVRGWSADMSRTMTVTSHTGGDVTVTLDEVRYAAESDSDTDAKGSFSVSGTIRFTLL